MSARALLILIALAFAGCGDNDNSPPRIGQVFVDGQILHGDECPLGSTEAYRTGDLIVCDACEDDTVCPNGGACTTICGPACQHDDGCCPVRVCEVP